MTGPRSAGTARFTLAAEWPALAVIAAVFALGWMLVSPWRNVPIVDDWVYAWSVEHLLKTGELRVSDYSSIYPVAQILWGALFAALAGFSSASFGPRPSSLPCSDAGRSTSRCASSASTSS